MDVSSVLSVFTVLIVVLSVCHVRSVNGGSDRVQIRVPGAPVLISDSDPELRDVLRFAEKQYNLLSDAVHIRKVSKVLSATKQVSYYLQSLYSHYMFVVKSECLCCHIYEYHLLRYN